MHLSYFIVKRKKIRMKVKKTITHDYLHVCYNNYAINLIDGGLLMSKTIKVLIAIVPIILLITFFIQKENEPIIESENNKENKHTIETIHLNVAEEDLNELDRKSTRLNSSHVSISYAVFCSKKKTLQ